MAAVWTALRKKRKPDAGGAPAEAPPKKRPGPNASRAELVAYLDKDGDGDVSAEEIQAYMEEQHGLGKNTPTHKTVGLRNQERVAAFYWSAMVQKFVAFVILFNFFAIIIEKEIDPYPAEYQQHRETWLAIDDICNIIFLIELLINMYGHFYMPFFCSGWNLLDLIVVMIGCVSLARVDLGALSQLKLLRAFRVLRLFKRIKSLNKILVSLFNAVPGVINAFVVMLIFMTIYAIVAVDLFRDFADTGEYTTLQRYGAADGQFGPDCGVDGLACANGSALLGGRFETSSTIPAITDRGFYYGQEYYGTFSRALYTLFQVLTGESWSEAVVRPLIFGWNPRNAFVVGLFFTSYILLTQVVLQNVVVAVLLDEFVADPEAEARKKKEQEEQQMKLIAALGGDMKTLANDDNKPSTASSDAEKGAAPATAASTTLFSPSKSGGPPWTVDEGKQTPPKLTPSSTGKLSQEQMLHKLAQEQEVMKAQLAEILKLLKDQKLAA